MQERNDAWMRDYGRQPGCRYQWSLDDAQLVLWSEGSEVVADICVLGSASERTFLRAWGNETIPPHARRGLERVREFGESNALGLLIQPEWPGGRAEGLEMAAVAGRILDAEGIWVEPSEDVKLFFALSRLRKTPHQARARARLGAYACAGLRTALAAQTHASARGFLCAGFPASPTWGACRTDRASRGALGRRLRDRGHGLGEGTRGIGQAFRMGKRCRHSHGTRVGPSGVTPVLWRDGDLAAQERTLEFAPDDAPELLLRRLGHRPSCSIVPPALNLPQRATVAETAALKLPRSRCSAVNGTSAKTAASTCPAYRGQTGLAPARKPA